MESSIKGKRAVGICLGATNVKVVELVREGETCRVARSIVRGHESNPRAVFQRIVEELGVDGGTLGAITGRKFRSVVNARSITEPEAIEQAIAYEVARGGWNGGDVLVSLGSESFIAYSLAADGTISAVETGNKCASGTGEFFLQQIRRMDLPVERVTALALGADPYSVSGRCSVFCKSDCTHALNKGVPIGRVTAGLCSMLADKVVELVEKIERGNVVAVGGVTRNPVVMDLLRGRVPGLSVPEHAVCYEALGAAYHALRGGLELGLDRSRLFGRKTSSFSFLPPIRDAEPLVTFEQFKGGTARDGDECIVGLDVGSTTTKAVVLRCSDDAVLASEYLRTSGDPVGASRRCYEALRAGLGASVRIVGLGVTGSGRHIAGLHGKTEAVINEIIAHATGAAFFDRGVDTIFEIGGQDAKYTHLTSGVPSDYAMNEACSAGTGSFLEESARESMGIHFTDIEDIALLGRRPPNFNDQCAAFISSDIKTASHEGIEREDIVAGLVYSICMNYVNRVKGQRPVGEKIFMQGGVCYNRAVPLAMANLVGRPIIVPPDPGLIGAFGVALEVKNRIAGGLMERGEYDLEVLASREVGHRKPFTCKGGRERCDRKCEIAKLVIDGRTVPFGGACDKYYMRSTGRLHDVGDLDVVRLRQARLYGEPGGEAPAGGAKRIGISRSYLMNAFFPLFSTFFRELGCEVVVADEVDPQGVRKCRSSFCYPAELAHGFLANLMKKDLDFIFLPKIMTLDVKNSVSRLRERHATCVLLQSEAYYLRSAFKNVPCSAGILAPVLDFHMGFDRSRDAFVEVAGRLGADPASALAALEKAIEAQTSFVSGMKRTGRELLARLESHPERSAVVLFGRTYNAFAAEANMGIPTKFASRGVPVIPWDCLPFEDEPCDPDMCWATGQELLKASSFVKKHPQLYGAFVTNFSCGPDSFLLGYFRDIMRTKPSLTLELDSHTADAGINTRIEAFLDIVERYRELGRVDDPEHPFTPAGLVFQKNIPYFVTSEGERVSFFDRRVHLLIPSMGRLSSEAIAAAFRGIGVRADAIPVYDFEDLQLGRANTSCKECMPLQLTGGGLLKYIQHREDDDELLAYFMPYTPGNCRFPQYSVFLRNMIRKKRLRNVALFSLTAEKGYVYQAFTGRDRSSVLKAFITADVMEDVKNALAVLAVDREDAMRIFEEGWRDVIAVLERGRSRRLYTTLEQVSARLAGIPLRFPLERAQKVALTGEVFVRRDSFSSQDLLDRLAAWDIVVKRTHFFEWLKYVDTIIKMGIYEPNFGLRDRIQFEVKRLLQNRYEKRIKTIVARSGLYEPEILDIDELLRYGQNFFDVRFRGESILAVGNFFKGMLHSYHGLISMGPFACMQSRVIQAVLSAESTMETKDAVDARVGGRVRTRAPGLTSLPYLSIETDGNPFPQILEARIETFCLQVQRVRERIDPGVERRTVPGAIAAL